MFVESIVHVYILRVEMATFNLQAEQYKARGNKALQEGKYEEAVELYGEAIALDPTNHVYFSNRAAAFANLKKYKESLTDANKTVELKPDWPKASQI